MGEVKTDEKSPPGGTPVTGLVVLGASAGSIEAILTLVGSLPANFPAPIVIAQHLDPHRPSQLAELLTNRSVLPVRTVSENEPLRGSTVYVVPADRDVEISDHYIGLREEGAGLSKPSVDRLMATAARVFGDMLTGVILTGSGADGAAGARAVKTHGGTVIIQNPDRAKFPDMPAAVAPAAVDIVAELEEIGPILVSLFDGADLLPAPGNDEEFRSFLRRVREQSDIDFDAYKRPTIERRLHRRMIATETATLADYSDYIARHPEEMQRLVSSFLIKVTQFFRDPELFASLRNEILPGLIDEARTRGELRIWSAGCATGEEAYTLAMLVTDLLGDDSSDLTVRIFATDVATEAVDFARQGMYPEAALAEYPADLRERHFIARDGTYEIRKSVRSLVVFGGHDLSQRAAFPRIDLILCRNVLIYFAPELQRRSLQLFAFSLRPNGYLALGKAETVNPLPDYFTAEDHRLKIYRRTGGALPVPPDRIFDSPSVKRAEPIRARFTAARDRVISRNRPVHQDSPALEMVRTLDAMVTGVAMIGRDYHIRSINMAARRLLGILSAGPGDDVVHRAVPVLAEPLRNALDAALRGETTTTMQRIREDAVDEDGRDLVITSSPAPSDNEGDPVHTVVLEVLDVSTLLQQQRAHARELDQVMAERDGLRERAETATAAVRALRAADQQMAAEQGRLRAENEHLQPVSEEAQAAAEEIETLNEEQQASNEELETLNEELQATVEELNTTNADLHARALELETLAATLAAQRAESEDARNWLQVILDNMSEAMLVVDVSGEVHLTNPAWDRLVGAAGEIVPEDDQGRPLPPDLWPQRRALEREASTLQFTLPGDDDVRRWFEATIQPVLVEDGSRLGVVVIRDISERSLRQLQQQFLALASHELRTPLTTLSGSLQLIARRLPEEDNSERLRRYVTRALEQVKRLEEHISELTDIVHLQSGAFRVERARLDLTELVRNTLEIARYMPNGQQIRGSLTEESIGFDGDARRLEQVLLNLLVNAFRHAPGPDGVDVRLRHEDGAAIIEVQDYGPGIPEAALPEIFSRFYQVADDKTVRAGLGLGLLIAREIVSAHDGSIAVESVEGNGSTFRVRLPLTDDHEVVKENREAVDGQLNANA